jgi:hypothetical protein
MHIKIQVVIEDSEAPVNEEIAFLERNDLSPETLGLTLEEGKKLLSDIQKTMVSQINGYISHSRSCPHCGKDRVLKDLSKKIHFRTVFGKLEISNPRFYTCICQDSKKNSFSPLTDIFPERISPEFLYIQTKWASLM